MTDPLDVLSETPNPSQHGVDDQTISRKRKRFDEDVGHLPDPFTIREGSSTATRQRAATLAITPLAILDRSCLPLAYLDPDGLGTRRFTGHLACLETPVNGALPDASTKVLVVRSGIENPPRLCVVERISRHDYILCRLLERVTLESLRPRCRLDVLNQLVPANGQQDTWWMSSAIVANPAIVSDIAPPERSINLFVRRSVSTSQPLNNRVVAAPLLASHVAPTSTLEQTIDFSAGNTATPDPETACQTFLVQYLETLYITKTPLAYFAKASLPRLRTAFGSAATTDSCDLAEFLRGMILASKTADTKYRVVLPVAAQDAAAVHNSDSESHKPAKKRKKDRKVKLDKKGLLPQELEYFSRWWRTDQGNLSMSDDSIVQHFKSRSPSLRTRETFLQVMLILETLAAEMTVSQGTSKDIVVDTPTEKPSTAIGSDIPEVQKKGKKKQDLNLALELLLDKLSIWHSLDQSTPRSGPPLKVNEQGQTNNVPRDFCIEVVIPFYASRLPGPSKVINQKLGGPVAPTPRQSRSSSSSMPKSHRTKSSAPEKVSRGPLQRMASESIRPLTDQSTVPSLQRSATDTQLGARSRSRQASETPSLTNTLRPMKSAATAAAPDKKPSALDKIRSRQREVDFDAMSQVQQAKKKRQAEIDAKLKEAIDTLKKPHRTLVSAEVADAVAQRELMAKGRAKAQAHAHAQGSSKHRGRASTQVQATPSHARTSMFVSKVDMTPGYGPATGSSVSMVPSSSVRPGPVPAFVPAIGAVGFDHASVEESPTHAALGTIPDDDATVEATPSRGANKFIKPALPASAAGFGRNSVARPLQWHQPRTSTRHIPKTPTKQARFENEVRKADNRPVGDGVDGTPDFLRYGRVEQTPVQETPLGTMSSVVPSLDEDRNGRGMNDDIPRKTGQGGEENSGVMSDEINIYDALGWND